MHKIRALSTVELLLLVITFVACGPTKEQVQRALQEKTRLAAELEAERQEAIRASERWLQTRDKGIGTTSDADTIGEFLLDSSASKNQVRELLGPPTDIKSDQWAYLFQEDKFKPLETIEVQFNQTSDQVDAIRHCDININVSSGKTVFCRVSGRAPWRKP